MRSIIPQGKSSSVNRLTNRYPLDLRRFPDKSGRNRMPYIVHQSHIKSIGKNEKMTNDQ